VTGEVWFYHLVASPLEQALPELLERALGRGLKVLLRTAGAARIAPLDGMLWTFRDDSFLPHGTAAGDRPERQPVLLTAGPGNANGAEILVLVDGARLDTAEAAGFMRTLLVFNGNDPGEVSGARAAWAMLKAAGHPAVYWSQEGGRWTEKARIG
jgi:DNA polymerase-3 subunit chi